MRAERRPQSELVSSRLRFYSHVSPSHEHRRQRLGEYRHYIADQPCHKPSEHTDVPHSIITTSYHTADSSTTGERGVTTATATSNLDINQEG